MLDPGQPAYTPVARALHWITAALVLSTIPVGLVMAELDGGPLQDFLYNVHETIGTVLMPIIVLRIVWRLGHPPLPLPPEIPALQRLGAEAVHWLLYLLLVVQPVVGWIGISAYGAPIKVFWTFVLPPIWPKDSAFSKLVLAAHDWIGFLIIALLCAHIAAALFHHFVRRDRVLLRMVTG
ncbi:MAG: cytochrome b [Xanthobacteraceae bacterium]|jgi:cytochrome b561